MYSNVEVVGRLTRDPELNTTGNDLSVVNFSVAVNREYSKNDEVDFHDVTAWRGLAESVAGHKKKGDLVLVKGKLRTDSWEQDGVKRKKTFILANEVVFLPSKNDGAGNSSNESSGDPNDIPF